MHRYSLPRRGALERLKQGAAADGRALDEQALRVIEAVELLSKPWP
jgi:response regulator NasT